MPARAELFQAMATAKQELAFAPLDVFAITKAGMSSFQFQYLVARGYAQIATNNADEAQKSFALAEKTAPNAVR
jgi:hypothetical protein